MRLARHWNRLPGEVVESPSMEVFHTNLDKVLSNIVQLTLPQLRGLNWMVSRGAFQSQHVCDSVTIKEKSKTERNEHHIALTTNIVESRGGDRSWNRGRSVRRKEQQSCFVLTVNPFFTIPHAPLLGRR